MAKKIEEPVETILSARPEEAPETEPAPEADQPAEQLKPVLDETEVAEIKAKARRQIAAKRKQKAKDSLLEQELRRLEREEGMVVGGVADQMVQVQIDLYEGADRIVLSGTTYFHGQTYTVPRHVADTLRDIMFRGWNAERIRKGDDMRAFYAQGRRTVISPVKGTVNAPKTAA